MSWDNMSKVRRGLITAMMMADIYRENLGLLVTKDTKMMVGDKEFHYEGKEIRLHEGNILQLGPDDDNMKNYDVTKIIDGVVHLKEVMFFKAKVTDGSMHQICVVAVDRKDAFNKLKEYCKENGYDRILSVVPSEFSEPFVR